MKHLELAVLGLAGVAVAGVGYLAVRSAGPLAAPATQPPREAEQDEEFAPHLCAKSEHLQEVVFLPHRYPERCGMGLTAVIHHGFSGIRIPASPEAQWMVNPPSEVAW